MNIPVRTTDPARHAIVVHHYAADGIDADERHDHWSARDFPSVAALFDSVALEPFDTRADQIPLGDLTVQFAEGTARSVDRSTAKLRTDGIAILGVNLQIDGVMQGEAAGRSFTVQPGGLLLLDMRRSSHVSVPRGRSIQIGIARALAQQHLGPVDRLHGRTVGADHAAMLLGHLLQLRCSLPGLAETQKRRLARTILDLLAIALDSADDPVSGQAPATRGGSMATVLHEIDAQLGRPSLGVASLCKALGMSRSALYRLFAGQGGVEAYIRRRRLERVHAALIDPGDIARIGDLARRWGFSDASHMARLFRDAYGVTPSSVRRNGAAEDGPQPHPGSPQPIL